MTKKRVIIITSIVITLVILLAILWFLCIKKEIHKNDSSDSTLIKSSTEQIDEKLNVSEDNIQENQIDVKEQEEQKEVKSSEEKKNTNNETKKDNTSAQPEIKKEEQQPVVETKKEEPVVQPTQPVQQPVNNSGPWDEYGISEYDYYHKPMWSWARIDYSISTYGSYEATHQACIDAGNQIEDAFSFSCTNINSYSGDYLGDMLRVKY